MLTRRDLVQRLVAARAAVPRKALLASVAISLFWATGARAATCPATSYVPHAKARDLEIVEAGELAASGSWGDARAVYLDLLAARPEDAEALFGLARVDSWEGCWKLAEGEYRKITATHPEDTEVLAGLVDLLVWEGRYDEADHLIDKGLAVAAHSPELLSREASLLYWRGEGAKAIALADQAESLAPDDGDIRATRDRMFMGETRVTARLDHYPAGYQDLATVGLNVMQRAGKFELSGGAQLVQRYGAAGTASVTDARYPVGLAYHPGLGTVVGVELAPGAPSNAIPDVAAMGWARFPLTTRFSGYLSYSFWHFGGGEIVHLFNPAVGIALPADLRLDLRTWLASVSLPTTSTHEGKSQLAGAVGAQLTWSATGRIDIAAAYTYGAELDQNPALYQLLTIRSHIALAYVDWLITRHFGVRPLVGIDHRELTATGSTLWVTSFEAGGYLRW